MFGVLGVLGVFGVFGVLGVLADCALTGEGAVFGVFAVLGELDVLADDAFTIQSSELKLSADTTFALSSEPRSAACVPVWIIAGPRLVCIWP